jgi:surface antigen
VKRLCGLLTALLTLVAVPAQVQAATPSPSPQQSLAQLNQQLTRDQATLAALNNEYEVDSAAVAALDARVAADSRRLKQLDAQMAQLARLEYQRPVLTLTAILQAASLQQLLSRLAQTRLIASQQARLIAETARLRQQDEQARAEAAAKLAQVAASRAEAAKIAAQALAARNNALAAEIAREAEAMVSSPPSSGPWPNHFYFGQCTWYVATLVYVPWYGNAIQWWANARPYYPEGQTPRVGAIMVENLSAYGHVAFVKSVNSDGSWTVSEMNYQGWDVVDTRTIKPGQDPVLGFIYPPAQDER